MSAAIATGATKPLTYDDLLAIPEENAERREILGGVLVVTASPSERHAWISGRLFRRLGDHVERLGLGEVYHAPVDVRLTQFDVVVPDIMFLRKDRRHLYLGRHVVDGPPDLIVEVRSPSTRSRDLTTKMQLYAQTGVQEYWVVDPDTSQITVYSRTARGAYELLSDANCRARSIVLPGFVIDPADLLRGMD